MWFIFTWEKHLVSIKFRKHVTLFHWRQAQPTLCWDICSMPPSWMLPQELRPVLRLHPPTFRCFLAVRVWSRIPHCAHPHPLWICSGHHLCVLHDCHRWWGIKPGNCPLVGKIAWLRKQGTLYRTMDEISAGFCTCNWHSKMVRITIAVTVHRSW